MGKEAKRERQKSNREAARVEREKMVRRSKQKRQAILLVGLLAAVFAVIFLIQLASDDDKKSSTTSTTSAPQRDYTAPPPMTIDPNKTYTAKIETNFGTIEMALDAKQAPKGVNNFVFLARNDFYNGLDFHRAVKDFVIQGGDPKGDGTGGPGYSEVGEAPPGGTYATASVAYAKGGAEPDFTFGSQFFITTGTPDALNASPGYAYLGRVTKGLDNAQKIEALAPDPATEAGTPTKKATIIKITIFENGTALKPTPAASTTSTGSTTTGTTTTIGASVSVGIPTTKP